MHGLIRHGIGAGVVGVLSEAVGRRKSDGGAHEEKGAHRQVGAREGR